MNANAKFLLRAKASENGSVIVSVIDTASRINYIGSSCPASVGAITHGLTSVTVKPQQGKTGVLAIQVLHQTVGEKEPHRELCYLFTTGHDSRPFVDLYAPFIPTVNCLAQLMDSGLYITVGDQKFVAPNFCHDKAEGLDKMKAVWAEQRIRVVNDANLLCRFLVGDAAITEVVAAAEAQEAAADWPAKYAGLEQLCTELEKAIEKLEAQRDAATSSARIILARALELQQLVETIIGIAQAAEFGDRKISLAKIAGYSQDAQALRLHLANFQMALPPEKPPEKSHD